MLESEVSEEDLARIPRLAPDCDPTSLELSPAEGFWFSRIDGQTSWKLLREIGGLTAGEVDLCIEDWLYRGLIDIDGRPPRVVRRKGRIPEPPDTGRRAAVGPIDESRIDLALDLDEATQRDILEFEQKLEVDDFALLGVTPAAQPPEIKRVYFSLSKRFHPDRYFRKNIGHYGERLHRIFKRISEAYELLSDPASRREIEQRLATKPRVDPGSQQPTASGGTASAPPLTPVERLAQRMPFRVPESVRDEKAAKGDALYRAALVSQKLGRLAEAASNMRLAVAFDPFNRDYKCVLGEVQAKLAYEQIEKMLASSSGGFSDSELGEARRLADEILLYRPGDAATSDLAAQVYLQLEDADRAEEYCSRAIELAPEVGAFRRTLASVHRLRGNKGHAVSQLKKALELDASDLKSREMLEALRIKPR